MMPSSSGWSSGSPLMVITVVPFGGGDVDGQRCSIGTGFEMLINWCDRCRRDCSGGWGRCVQRWGDTATSWPWRLRPPAGAEGNGVQFAPNARYLTRDSQGPARPPGLLLGLSLLSRPAGYIWCLLRCRKWRRISERQLLRREAHRPHGVDVRRDRGSGNAEGDQDEDGSAQGSRRSSTSAPATEEATWPLGQVMAWMLAPSRIPRFRAPTRVSGIWNVGYPELGSPLILLANDRLVVFWFASRSSPYLCAPLSRRGRRA